MSELSEAQQQIEELKRLVTLQRAYLAQSPDERLKALQLDLDVEKAAMASCIATIGGTIEGNPTGRHNFLRRLRELVAAEKQMNDLITSNNAAWIEMVKCDDIKLDQPLANAIFDLQRTRESLEKQLAEARAQVEELKRERDEAKRQYALIDLELAASDESGRNLMIDATAALEERSKLLAKISEARTVAFKEAAEIARRPCPLVVRDEEGITEHCIATREAVAAALERAAEGSQEPQAFEIHNRFCGENGEPCQVCRLKAEREEKK